MWYEHELDFIDKVGTPFQVTARLKPTSLEDLAAETNVAQIKGMVTVLGVFSNNTYLQAWLAIKTLYWAWASTQRELNVRLLIDNSFRVLTVILSLTRVPFDLLGALKATGNRGLQPAMDHILEHEGEAVPDLGGVSEQAGSRSAPMEVDEDDEDAEALKSLGALKGNAVEAKSIKCSECGKIFKNTALANFHAEKSGHDQFEESTEEIKPLTEEEKKQKLEELREKMTEKRSKKALEEAKEHKANEALRRKAGKDMNKIKEDLQLKQAMKEAEAKKRGLSVNPPLYPSIDFTLNFILVEKIEDAKAKAAIKAQIEADKKARAEKAAREKALRDGQPVPESAPSAGPSHPAVAPAVATAGKDFKETRLQIRMSTGGQPYTTTLSSDAPLREVAEFLAVQVLTVDVDTVTLAQHFPRKTFSREDFSKSLKDLGLTPSAVIRQSINKN
ncbi:hypothetical protein CVT25_003215 [Psilocybe cyanescens]|uniref:UBX domain-containing protein n=1 Tax=Psilocybe cyanescens TaxID=93625 RepID=A0A409WMJ5_PSICY|nr:hypothetical protein CVT25_003215 [Psilocybe cyanescens]